MPSDQPESGHSGEPPLAWGINPRSTNVGVIHATWEVVPEQVIDMVGADPVVTFCNRTLRLLPMSVKANDDRPCKVCERRAADV